MSEPLVRCRGVSVVFGAATALAEADLEVQPSERVALVGRSGSGKTTLLHVLGGLVVPSSGTVDWKGKPLAGLDAAARASVRRHGLAYVFQGANLLPYFSAVENVAFAAHLAGGTATPLELLGLVGLAGKADHLPAELSGGEQQRVAIARAIAQQPELLLCDEPTGHLDSDTAERVLELIDAVQAELGLAVVVATHDAGVASRFDRVVELADGKVRSETVLA
ncbi:MAG TPA: ABC transporter ATP-binding protein [Gaiellaceae bacterium]|nr:ABC transporter ATP-binding protein [Gaiellaceae bacterium]